MKLIHDLSLKQIETLFELYQKEWWTSARTLEETKQVIDGSQICFGIVDEDELLIGFARVITDFTFKAFIFDVIINDKFRNKGIGHLLIESIKNYPKIKAVKTLELYCLPELEQFYEKHGFSSDVGGIQLMRLKNA
jgi:N-acetylglutamate synthase-like GNAT family acetyltransferase